MDESPNPTHAVGGDGVGRLQSAAYASEVNRCRASGVIS